MKVSRTPLPECHVCGMLKKPIGRDPGVIAANSYCGHDCEGYYQEPLAPHYWPGEEIDDEATARG